MKTRQLTLSFLFLVLSICVGYGQSIQGKVVDAKSGEPLPFSSVAVFQKIHNADSLLAGSQTDMDGNFQITSLPVASLSIRISFVGYQPFEKIVQISSDNKLLALGPLALVPEATMLKEIQVVAEKADMEITPDKRIFNVSKNMTAIGGTAETLLRNVPSVTIDESGAASLRNMPTTIYVDGKPTQLTLAQIPANQIASVEVISNPSARYDASTSGGIVNLVLKQNRDEGYNGLITLGLGNNARYDATANLDWQKGKWNITTLYSLNATKNPLPGYVHRTSKDGSGQPINYFNQHTDIDQNNQFQSGRIEADYRVNPFNTLALAGTVAGGVFNTVSQQQYFYASPSGKVESFGGRNTVPHNDYINTGVELDWKHKFLRKDQSLHVMGSVTHNNVSNAGDWLTTAYSLQDGDTLTNDGYPVQNRIDGKTVGNQLLAQLDYTHPVSETVKWEFGLRSFTYKRDQEYFFNEVRDGESVLLQDYSQDAKITETVNAAYAMYSNKLTSTLSMQAGLRVEQSSLHGLSRFDGSKFGYNYPSSTGQNIFQSLFPSLAFSKTVDETSEWNISLSRKVGRPNFRHMFVGIQANDRQNITIGNPNVKPEFVNTAELSYSKTWSKESGTSLQWLPTAYYIYEDHTIKPVTSPLSTDSTVLVTTFQNVKADIQYGLDNTLIYTTGPLSVVANVNTYEVIIQSRDASFRQLALNGKINVTYKFGAGISTQISAQRRSKRPQLQGYQQAVNGVDFAIRKGFLQNRASVTFSINDVFNSRKFLTVYDQPDTYQVSMGRRDIRYFKLSLQLPLGKLSGGKPKERKISQPDIDFSN